ncbi:MAG: glycosyltransferase family 4 protein [Muribaculaceae bacterium]|nr:glycosyltransferase family 4 protein [Muribaculaceae bacterium]
MKIDVIVSGIEPGGGITTFVIQFCKVLGDIHSLRLIVTHTKVNKEQIDYLKPLLKRGIKDISKSHKLWRYIRLTTIWLNDMPEYIINNYNAVGQYLLPLLTYKPKNIHIVHGITSDFKRIALINKAYTTHWVVPSKRTAELLNTGNKSIDIDRITIIPHGVEDVSYKTVDKIKDRINLIYVGVLEEHKGVDVLPEVIKELEKRGISYKFDIVGEGVLRENISRRLVAEIADDKVEFYGSIKHERVLEMFTYSDILVYPTRMDSFGLVITEAMMAGCVPIAGKITGVTDQIIDNARNGFTVPVESEIIAEKICQLAYNRDILVKMAERARVKAKKQYSVSNMSDSYNKLLTHLL